MRQIAIRNLQNVKLLKLRNERKCRNQHELNRLYANARHQINNECYHQAQATISKLIDLIELYSKD